LKLFNMNLRPFMDELDSGGGGGEPAPSSTEPVNNEPAGEPNSGVADPGMGADVASQKKVQTPEENHVFAEMRRKADAAEKRANDLERNIATGKKYGKDYNIYSDADVAEKYGQSHGVNTVAEFEAALQKEAQDQEYKDKGIDPDMVQKIVSSSPEMQALRAQQGRDALSSEISELSAEYPDLKVKTLEDMQKWSNFDAIKAKALNGMTVLEAYETVNRAEIRKKNSESAKQAALNSIQSKGHLQGNGNGVEGDTVRVPDDVMEMYKRFNPKQTTEQIKAHYKKSQK